MSAFETALAAGAAPETEGLKQSLARALSAFFEPLHRALDATPPIVWQISACTLLLAGALWTVFLSRESVYRGAPSESRWCDLRLWAVLVIIPFVLIYLYFG